MIKFTRVILMTILFSFTASIGKAQSTQLFSPSDSVPKIELRYLHPFYKSLDKQGLLSGGYDIAFSYPINRTWNVQASIPLLFAKYEFESYYYGYGGGYGYGYLEPDVISKKDNAIGNIMIGVQSNRFLQKNRVFSFDLQLFLPTAPKDYNDAADYAAYANVYEFQKYLWDVTSVAVKGTYSSNPESGWIYAMSGGVMYLIGGSNSGLDDDLCVSYMLGMGYKVKSFTFGIDYQGLINLTNDFLNDFRDRMFDAVNIGAQYSFGNFQPSLFYSVNTRNDLRDFISGTLGLKLAYRFAK